MSDREGAGPGGWVEFRLGGPLAGLEVFAEFMDGLGAGGAVFSEDPAGPPGAQMVTVFLASELADVETVWRIRSRAESLRRGFEGEWQELGITRVDNREWTEQWKQGLKPERLEPGIWIVPSFIEVPEQAANEPVIRMDPGMAFGTGLHPTTRMCVNMVCSEVKKGARSVMDIGTGTGILAMAAALFGADRILALEIDPIALKTANENIESNGLAHRIALAPGVEEPDHEVEGRPFDLVAANLFAESLARIMPFIERNLAGRGAAVTAGILHDRAGMVEDAIAGCGMKVNERTEEEGWVTLLSGRRSEG